MSALDRDAAREQIEQWKQTIEDWDALVDRMEACVRPALPQGIDRDAVTAVVLCVAPELTSPYRSDWEKEKTLQAAIDRILALLPPVEG